MAETRTEISSRWHPSHPRRARTSTFAAAILVVTGVTACKSSSNENASNAPATDISPSQPGDGRQGQPQGASDGGTAPTIPYKHYDINHVLGTGQSLSLGAMGTPPLSTTQPFGNLMFDTGLEPKDAAPTSFIPLTEVESFMDAPVETPSSSLANLVTQLARTSLASFPEPQRNHVVLVSLHGVSGASYPMVGKNTDAYKRGLTQVRQAKAIADAQGKTYVVRAVTSVHGESDGWQNWNTEYANALVDWQAAYDADVKAITGQTADIPMFHTQYSAWTPVETAPTNIIPMLQLEAHKRALGKVVLVGPKYFLPYAPDGLHLTNEGYRWLGEYYAKAYTKQVIEGQRWEPVRPKQVTRAGKVVTVTFFVPAPPLVLDTTLVKNPGNFGFEVSDDSGAAPAITNVAVTAPDTVQITLAAEPTGNNRRVRYAYTGNPGHVAGPEEGPRGNLRDSDATVSRHGYKLYDWCVHFDEPMP